jgi:hypothetical protein
VEFFDFLYLGIFVILSPAFDNRFYSSVNPPANVVAEITYAKQNLYHLFHIFSMRFIIVLEGEVVALSYVVNRLLAEFAAAAVNFSRAIDKSNGDEGDWEDKNEDAISTSSLTKIIEEILKESYSQIIPYYTSCLVHLHKHFTWTGPKLEILPRLQDFSTVIPLLSLGEMLELPGHQIYSTNLDPEPSLPPTIQPLVSEGPDQAEPSFPPDVQPLTGKRPDQADAANPSDGMRRKRRRLH